MKFWIFAHGDQSSEDWLDDYKRRFDAWGAAGVAGIIVWPMRCRRADGWAVASYPVDAEIYREHRVEPPAQGPRDPLVEGKFQAMLDDAAARGWKILTFGMGRGGIAGLEEITSGEIYIDGKLVNDIPPKDRDIAMVFQNYALYPHMTVYQNMAFGLKLRKYPKEEIDDRVREAADIPVSYTHLTLPTILLV